MIKIVKEETCKLCAVRGYRKRVAPARSRTGLWLGSKVDKQQRESATIQCTPLQ